MQLIKICGIHPKVVLIGRFIVLNVQNRNKEDLKSKS